MRRLLLCTDLDRTVIPNGAHIESPRAKGLFERLVQRQEVTLVYVSGRHRRLIEQAIDQWDLPTPDMAIGDVGTTIYEVTSPAWTMWEDWQQHLQNAWSAADVERLKEQLSDLPQLWLQENEKQNQFKVSYYLELDTDLARVRAKVETLCETCRTAVKLIWSIDHENHLGLLDILPPTASKLSAIEYLMQRQRFELSETLFAGDSGNDLDVFRSQLNCVVVANADPDIKRWALAEQDARLYVASGQLFELNGNYRSGILEGAYHFWPEIVDWLR